MPAGIYKQPIRAVISIPDSVTTIEPGAFKDCTSLASVTIGNGVTSIGNSTSDHGAFHGCTNLTSVTFTATSKVTSIGFRAFYQCTSLTSINIPNSVTSIGDSVFDDCTSLASVTIPAGVTTVGFIGRGLTSLTAINVDAGNTAYSSQDGVLYNKNKTEVIKYPQGKTGAFTIPAGVTSIGGGLFPVAPVLPA